MIEWILAVDPTVYVLIAIGLGVVGSSLLTVAIEERFGEW
jgi:hypothetical protein